jgi:hypothetical protein
LNTKFSYLYRDVCNYKTFNEVIISGTIGFEDIRPYLKDKTFFIPSEVGLTDLQDCVFSIDDHIWHEIDSIQATQSEPTVKIHAKLIISKFKKAHQNNWNEYDVFKRKGLIWEGIKERHGPLNYQVISEKTHTGEYEHYRAW